MGENATDSIPNSYLEHPLVSTDPEDRIRHARGQSFPDWNALRSGRLERTPNGARKTLRSQWHYESGQIILLKRTETIPTC